MSEMKLAIQMAYETAEKEFPHGHLKGEQIKAFLASAMALVDTQQAMLMNGKTVSAGTFKLKPFPTEKFKKDYDWENFDNLAEENFLNTVVGVPPAVVEKEEDKEQIPTPKMKFDAESFMTLSPKQAVETYGIETIEQMIKNLKVDVASDKSDKQKAGALITFLKSKK